jgi:hypothetical protein
MRAAARFALCEIHLAVKVLLPMKLVIRGFLAVNLVRSVRVGPSSQVGVSPIRALLDLRACLGPARLWFRHQGERIIGFGFGRDFPAADMEAAASLAAVDDQPMPLAALAGCLVPELPRHAVALGGATISVKDLAAGGISARKNPTRFRHGSQPPVLMSQARWCWNRFKGKDID